MKRIWRILQNKINDFSISRKLATLYIVCVIVPLLLTDGIIFAMISSRERNDERIELQNICNSVEADLNYTMAQVLDLTNDIYTNRRVRDFLVARYSSELDYYSNRYEFLEHLPLELLQGGPISEISFYADNDTIVNGGYVYRMDDAKAQNWYRTMGVDKKDSVWGFYYVGSENPTATMKRRFAYVRKLGFFKDANVEQLVKVELDYSALVQKLRNMNYQYPVLICQDNVILYANNGFSNNTQSYYHLSGDEKIAYEKDVDLYGTKLRILCLKEESALVDVLRNYLPLIIFLVATNLLLPILMGRVMYSSFVNRLMILSTAFDKADADSLHEIDETPGKDEIGALMNNYNYMARRINELIRTVYTDRLEKQEMDIERQNAELLALESQINPHFLFNVLESLRMHCLLKGEKETASMIERLALLERQNVDWVSDYQTVEKEVKFIEAYLQLQQYRFGDRFHFEIEADSETLKCMIPKLTLTTFVENACVHGIEKKTADCWIYVRAYEKEDMLVLEIEDTGTGMEDEQVEEMKTLMENCTIDDLKKHTHVGIINACLRLHMMTKRQVQFEVESELGVGTFTTIKVPKEYTTGV